MGRCTATQDTWLGVQQLGYMGRCTESQDAWVGVQQLRMHGKVWMHLKDRKGEAAAFKAFLTRRY